MDSPLTGIKLGTRHVEAQITFVSALTASAECSPRSASTSMIVRWTSLSETITLRPRYGIRVVLEARSAKSSVLDHVSDPCSVTRDL